MTNLNKNYKKAFSLVEISIVILIIGLLIAGISKASDMIFDANLKGGRSLTKSAKVGRLPNLALWLETTSAESILDKERYDGTTISIWRDINPQSTSKFIFKSSGAPKYVEQGQNNLPAIGKFAAASGGDVFLPYSSEDASATVLAYPSTQTFSSGAYATIFVVLKPKAVATNLINFCEYSTGITTACGTGKEIGVGLGATATIIFNFMGASNATTALTSTNTYEKRNLIIVSAVKDTVNQKLLVNGTDKVEVPTASANTYATTNSFSGTFRVGGTTSDGVEIYEIIVYSSNLTNLERQSVEAYLGKKYNIPMTQTNI